MSQQSNLSYRIMARHLVTMELGLSKYNDPYTDTHLCNESEKFNNSMRAETKLNRRCVIHLSEHRCGRWQSVSVLFEEVGR